MSGSDIEPASDTELYLNVLDKKFLLDVKRGKVYQDDKGINWVNKNGHIQAARCGNFVRKLHTLITLNPSTGRYELNDPDITDTF